jgi:hypothetical protein
MAMQAGVVTDGMTRRVPLLACTAVLGRVVVFYDI